MGLCTGHAVHPAGTPRHRLCSAAGCHAERTWRAAPAVPGHCIIKRHDEQCAAISPITLDWLARDIVNIVEHSIGHAAFDTSSPHGLLYLGGARMYLNLSNLLRFSSPARLAKGNAPTDQLAADILAGIDVQRYRAE